MKKRVVGSAALVLLAFVSGWAGACVLIQRQGKERLASQQKIWEDRVKSMRSEIYGNNDFHTENGSPEIKAKLGAYTPSRPDEVISLSYVGGMAGRDTHLSLFGNGELRMEREDRSQLLTTLSKDRCKLFFHRVLTSGVLNYSDDVVALKESLLPPDMQRGVTCNPQTHFRISVPDFQVEKAISIYTPQIELENYPDIVEFQLIVQLEKEILELVPKDYPLWER
jgi:hypothetical protein